MGDITVIVNSTEFEGAMVRIREGVKRGLVDPSFGTLGVQGRLLAERCQEFTPPRNVGQGKASVARDLQRIFQPLNENTFTNSKSLRTIIRNDKREDWNASSRNFSGSLANSKAIAFSKSWHDTNRNNQGKGPKRYLGVVTLGPQGVQARQYGAQVAKRVGWAKAGWNAAITGLGGAIKGIWLSQHGGSGGSLIDGRQSAEPYVQGINSTGWARSGEGDRILRNAISARIRDMESYVNRLMKIAAEGKSL